MRNGEQKVGSMLHVFHRLCGRQKTSIEQNLLLFFFSFFLPPKKRALFPFVSLVDNGWQVDNTTELQFLT